MNYLNWLEPMERKTRALQMVFQVSIADFDIFHYIGFMCVIKLTRIKYLVNYIF